MKAITHSYFKIGNRYLLLSKNSDKNIYKNFGKNDLFLKMADENCSVKIRNNRKYGFPRILFKYIKSLDIWIAKFPNSNDLLVLKKHPTYNKFIIEFHIGQWEYRTLFLSNI